LAERFKLATREDTTESTCASDQLENVGFRMDKVIKLRLGKKGRQTKEGTLLNWERLPGIRRALAACCLVMGEGRNIGSLGHVSQSGDWKSVFQGVPAEVVSVAGNWGALICHTRTEKKLGLSQNRASFPHWKESAGFKQQHPE